MVPSDFVFGASQCKAVYFDGIWAKKMASAAPGFWPAPLPDELKCLGT
ncbi:MAG: hypothetical protein CFH41_01309, partial [Alphaproteobacteria bacterium MarineAlpha11_Bin1]